jgi:D-xylonolactonase
MDTQGYLWSASYDAGSIIRYSAEGFEERRIDLPVRKVTSLAFGGRGLNCLYITAAGGDDRTRAPLAGSLFRVKLGISGLPRFLSRILL